MITSQILRCASKVTTTKEKYAISVGTGAARRAMYVHIVTTVDGRKKRGKARIEGKLTQPELLVVRELLRAHTRIPALDVESIISLTVTPA